MKVGVTIPVRNGERYLAETIESVLGQTVAPHDVVVVDDGSEDRTVEIARRYAPEVRHLSQAPAGIGGARNSGVAEVAGDLLTFVDGDDVWPADRLERQLEALRTAPRPDLVFGHIVQFVSPELSHAAAAELHCAPEPEPACLANTMLLPRAVWNRVGPFSTEVVRSEFLEWLIRARELKLREVMIDAVVLRRRLHARNHGRLQRSSGSEYARILKQALDRRRAAETGGEGAPSAG